jgi:transcriptional regulator with XRE-family HTH domain
LKPPSESEIRKTLAAAIAAGRRAHHWTQAALAEKCGLPRSYVADLEGGRRNPSLRNLIRIANALRVPLSDLFR